jgi:hypothetical protein
VKTAPPQTAPAKATPTPAQRPARSRSDDDEDSFVWWQSIGWGFLCFGIAGFSYWALAAKEAAHESFRARWWIVLLYSIGGKWLVAGLFIAFGLLGVAVGVMQYFEEK